MFIFLFKLVKKTPAVSLSVNNGILFSKIIEVAQIEIFSKRKLIYENSTTCLKFPPPQKKKPLFMFLCLYFLAKIFLSLVFSIHLYLLAPEVPQNFLISILSHMKKKSNLGLICGRVNIYQSKSKKMAWQKTYSVTVRHTKSKDILKVS